MAGSRLSPRFSQQFLSNGIGTWLSSVLTQQAISPVLMTSCESGVSLPRVKKDLIVPGTESQTLRGVPAQGESRLASSPVAVQRELERRLIQRSASGKGLSASRSHLGRRASSRGGHRRTATLPCRQGLEKAHSCCRIDEIKCLACSQIAYSGQGKHRMPCTHNVLCSLINESLKKHLLFLY